MRKFISLSEMLFIAIILIISSCQSGNNKTENKLPVDRKWWKEAVVYQVYPRSFKDSDGDGIGDLQGIISRLDYLKSLGIDAVWLNPVYTSPNFDNGYDVSDYENIMKEFGTMQDFDNLLNGLHERGIKLVMDVVVNHTSSEHEWFKQSRSSRSNPYRNYYHWWNAERGKPAPRWSFFDVNGDAWKYDSLTNAYYLHYFSQQQPDLNWENPEVRQEVYKMMRFWLDKGVDALRLDAFQFAAKDTSFPVFPAGYEKHIVQYYGMGPHLHDYLQEMNHEVFNKYDIMTVAEGAGNTYEDAHNLVDSGRHELNIAYHFEGIDIGKDKKDYNLLDFKKAYTRWDSAFAQDGWLAIYLANHDNARMVSRFGNDDPAFRELSSKMLTTFIMTMRGTPFYYNGDELGMDNIKFDKIEDYRDIATINEYKNIQNKGGDLEQFLTQQKFLSRDNGRTPFQWDSTSNAGFTAGVPWIKVNPDYITVNESAEDKDSNSVLNYFRKIVRLRKENPVLIYGKYTLLDKNNPDVYAYTRELKNGSNDLREKWLIVLNFSKKNMQFDARKFVDYNGNELMLSNYKVSQGENEGIINLKPYEARVYKLGY